MGMQMRQQPCPNCRAVLVYDTKDGRAAENVTCPYCGWTRANGATITPKSGADKS